MALETLKNVEEIGGVRIVRGKGANMTWDEFDESRKENPIHITDRLNTISFRIQDGPIKEAGVNGCQVDTIIATAKVILEELNKKFPCRENSIAITKLDESLLWLGARTANREKRGVEGYSKT